MKIIWTDFAIENLKNIFDFYASISNKKSAHKIRRQILKSSKQLLAHPESGQVEINLIKLKQNHRYLVSGNYKIIYRIDFQTIIITDIFDSRQNPTKMMEENRLK